MRVEINTDNRRSYARIFNDKGEEIPNVVAFKVEGSVDSNPTIKIVQYIESLDMEVEGRFYSDGYVQRLEQACKDAAEVLYGYGNSSIILPFCKDEREARKKAKNSLAEAGFDREEPT